MRACTPDASKDMALQHTVTFNLPGMQVNKIWLKDIYYQGKAWFR